MVGISGITQIKRLFDEFSYAITFLEGIGEFSLNKTFINLLRRLLPFLIPSLLP